MRLAARLGSEGRTIDETCAVRRRWKTDSLVVLRSEDKLS